MVMIALTIGQRDQYLMAVREATFGQELAAFTGCPTCQEQLEFTCTTADMRINSGASPEHSSYQISIEKYECVFRVPTSLDLATIVHVRNSTVARQMLLERCILQIRYEDTEAVPIALPEVVTTALAEHMARHDPQAEVQIDFTCPVCGHSWSQLFDIAGFIWIEITTAAKRLLQAVHTLARAYGWCEADILALSAVRRAFYIEMVT
jgi:hypothetical protein